MARVTIRNDEVSPGGANTLARVGDDRCGGVFAAIDADGTPGVLTCKLYFRYANVFLALNKS